ncbi:uncharacterized protein LOC143079667 isoform X2 [Mytilus galloprovincialis]|uniref:tumor protein p53-inducible nuclear protein 1-like isoform X2 n=1 Tax=Mytilus edulis TaxID=6550 RepID=UPI0039EDF719
MFSSVTSYFFGGSTDSEQNDVDLQTKPAPEKDQEWILVDLPAGGSNSSNVEMTPMENLLIEHPSMSVYNSRCSGSTGDASDLSESSNDDQSPSATRKILPRKVKTSMARQDPRKPNAVAARAGLVSQIQMVKSSQRSLKQSDSKKLSRHNLQRLNKSLNHQIGGGKPYNKSGRIHCPAGRSNAQMKH